MALCHRQSSKFPLSSITSLICEIPLCCLCDKMSVSHMLRYRQSKQTGSVMMLKLTQAHLSFGQRPVVNNAPSFPIYCTRTLIRSIEENISIPRRGWKSPSKVPPKDARNGRETHGYNRQRRRTIPQRAIPGRQHQLVFVNSHLETRPMHRNYL